ncbi:predicted protein [Uncinocarpus reesii 1704]|uniref:Uncharacterized protein n=1 Tax=Uncinocarpus reesii (strain UAMH 1704) TaxID=336963 RepID=C4JE55_UNCRE|nr:uncharacterized protein UREG_00477 [Uncinocarpus reesii 1704]EEP75631.1 predicted protein [Uncinocarpus reesii 1704]
MTLNKQAASRFIKHGLVSLIYEMFGLLELTLLRRKAGNDKIDLERAEREAKERAMAQLRAAQLAKKQAAAAAAAVPASVPQKRPAEEEAEDASECDAEEDDKVDGDVGAATTTEEYINVNKDTANPRRKGKKRKNRPLDLPAGKPNLPQENKHMKRLRKQKRQKKPKKQKAQPAKQATT